MGGPCRSTTISPGLVREIRAIRETVDRGKPVLGICLGAQLIAKALGSKVYRNPVKEIGWAQVYWTEQTAVDPLFRGFSRPETVFHWHGETFDLPEGGERLAYSEACANQAFRIAGNVYGMQFHLEVTPEIITDWLRQDAACGDLREAAAPIDPYVHADPLAAVAAATVFDGWCGLLT